MLVWWVAENTSFQIWIQRICMKPNIDRSFRRTESSPLDGLWIIEKGYQRLPTTCSSFFNWSSFKGVACVSWHFGRRVTTNNLGPLWINWVHHSLWASLVRIPEGHNLWSLFFFTWWKSSQQWIRNSWSGSGTLNSPITVAHSNFVEPTVIFNPC
jgi:hypothetical protein